MQFFLKTESFAKLFFLVSCSGLFLYTIMAFYSFHTTYSNISLLQKYQRHIQGLPNPENDVKMDRFNKDLKYILIWSIFNNTPNPFGDGLYPFVDNKCSYMNCYLTTNKYMLNENITNFDAIVFKSNILKYWKRKTMPEIRSSHQIYIYYSKESSVEAPVCNTAADDYFNWTCSYKLDSDIVAPFIEVKDLDGNFIAPKKDVKWESAMVQVEEKEKKSLRHKTFAMAWFVQKCSALNDRMNFALKLQRAFKQNSLVFDIFGCSFQECPKEGCLETIKKNYYFYFAAEDSNADDFVTAEVLNAYSYDTVPVVFGGADYHRFLPEGSYINAINTSVDRLAALIDYIIRNPMVYFSFFRWKRFYTIKEMGPFREFCKICELLNTGNQYRTSVYKENFRMWWYNDSLSKRCFPKSAESLSFVLSYGNSSYSKNIKS